MGKIKFGKNVIENLTSGMYQDSRIVYREYIQNSADQIDIAVDNGMYRDDESPRIDISIDKKKRLIRIEDNATGIEKGFVHTELADVADSKKKREQNKGFRGIGRLGGLAYCDTLRFVTSAAGEDIKTVMEWDAQKCMRLINDSSVRDDAETILLDIIDYREEPCPEEDHFFIVELVGIKKENEDLLNVDRVKEYISENTPIPINNNFIFDKRIYDYAKEKGYVFDEYNIFVNGEDMLKPYVNDLYEKSDSKKRKYDEIVDIHYREFKTSDGNPLAWMWYGVSSFERQIPKAFNRMRGVRLRKGNIQIGGSDCLAKLFKESRGTHYFLGEVHALHPDLIPNGRRDYFNENEIRVEFEEELRWFFGETLHKLYYAASNIKNAFKAQHTFLEKQKQFVEKEKKGLWVSTDEKNELEVQLGQSEKKANAAKKRLDNWREKATEDASIQQVLSIVEGKHGVGLDSSTKTTRKTKKKSSKKKSQFMTDELTALTKKERKLVSRIYTVIRDVLKEDQSSRVIGAIQKELKGNGKKNTLN